MERTSLHNDSLLYASLIAILLLISYWFTTRCFKIISGIEGMGLGTWGDRVMLTHPIPFHILGGKASQAFVVEEGYWGCPSASLGHFSVLLCHFICSSWPWSCSEVCESSWWQLQPSHGSTQGCSRGSQLCCAAGVWVPLPLAAGRGCRQAPWCLLLCEGCLVLMLGPQLAFWGYRFLWA